MLFCVEYSIVCMFGLIRFLPFLKQTNVGKHCKQIQKICYILHGIVGSIHVLPTFNCNQLIPYNLFDVCFWLIAWKNDPITRKDNKIFLIS